MTGHRCIPQQSRSFDRAILSQRYEEFQEIIGYPITPDARSEVPRSRSWTNTAGRNITAFGPYHRSTVRKWLRHRPGRRTGSRGRFTGNCSTIRTLRSAPQRKVYFRTIRSFDSAKGSIRPPDGLKFRLSPDHGIELGPTTIKKSSKLDGGLSIPKVKHCSSGRLRNRRRGKRR